MNSYHQDRTTWNPYYRSSSSSPGHHHHQPPPENSFTHPPLRSSTPYSRAPTGVDTPFMGMDLDTPYKHHHHPPSPPPPPSPPRNPFQINRRASPSSTEVTTTTAAGSSLINPFDPNSSPFRETSARRFQVGRGQEPVVVVPANQDVQVTVMQLNAFIVRNTVKNSIYVLMVFVPLLCLILHPLAWFMGSGSGSGSASASHASSTSFNHSKSSYHYSSYTGIHLRIFSMLISTVQSPLLCTANMIILASITLYANSFIFQFLPDSLLLARHTPVKYFVFGPFVFHNTYVTGRVWKAILLFIQPTQCVHLLVTMTIGALTFIMIGMMMDMIPTTTAAWTASTALNSVSEIALVGALFGAFYSVRIRGLNHNVMEFQFLHIRFLQRLPILLRKVWTDSGRLTFYSFPFLTALILLQSHGKLLIYLRVVWFYLVATYVVALLWSLGWRALELFLTSHFDFSQIEYDSALPAHTLLFTALNEPTTTLLHHLALVDVEFLVNHQPKRRLQVFLEPSGMAWKVILDACRGPLYALSCAVIDILGLDDQKGAVGPDGAASVAWYGYNDSTEIDGDRMNASSRSFYNSSEDHVDDKIKQISGVSGNRRFPATKSSIPYSFSSTTPVIVADGAAAHNPSSSMPRNSRLAQPMTPWNTNISHSNSTNAQHLPSLLSFHTRTPSMRAALHALHVSYSWNPPHKNLTLLQTHLTRLRWYVDILAKLMVHSIHEDKYGIAHQALPHVLDTLLTSYTAFNAYHQHVRMKMASLNRRHVPKVEILEKEASAAALDSLVIAINFVVNSYRNYLPNYLKNKEPRWNPLHNRLLDEFLQEMH